MPNSNQFEEMKEKLIAQIPDLSEYGYEVDEVIQTVTLSNKRKKFISFIIKLKEKETYDN